MLINYLNMHSTKKLDTGLATARHNTICSITQVGLPGERLARFAIVDKDGVVRTITAEDGVKGLTGNRQSANQ